jgi:hypothetical protein
MFPVKREEKEIRAWHGEVVAGQQFVLHARTPMAAAVVAPTLHVLPSSEIISHQHKPQRVTGRDTC